MKAKVNVVSVSIELSVEEAQSLLALLGRCAGKSDVGKFTIDAYYALHSVLMNSGIPIVTMVNDNGKSFPTILLDKVRLEKLDP